jgi:outer membrane immunogenic protein
VVCNPHVAMKKIFLGIVVLSLSAVIGSANAADWTGFYAGLNAGGVGANVDVNWEPNLAGFPVTGLAIIEAARGDIDESGFIAGGQIGFNYQAQRIVAGIEADGNYTDLKDTRSATAAASGFPGHVITQRFESKWLATLRGRLGLAIDPVFIYTTAGLAVAHVKYSDRGEFAIAGSSNAASSSQTRGGWTTGVGVEWGLTPHWSVKAEYLYVDLGRTKYRSENDTFPFSDIRHNHKLTENIARLGFNYKF